MQHLFGSEIPDLVRDFQAHIRTKHHAEVLVEENQNAQGKTVYDVFLSENAPHFFAIKQETEVFLTEWRERKNAQAWQNGVSSINVPHESPSANPQSNSQFSFLSYFQQQKITVFLTALCALIYLLMFLGFAEPLLLLSHFPAEPEQEDEIWRYLSHTLVHLSNMHILFNLTWWWIFGGAIERQLGSIKLLQIYLLAGVITGVAQNVASGVVYAVLGYVFVLDKLNKQTDFEVPDGFFYMLVVGILLGFAGPLVNINIGNTAHISGLLVGMLVAFLDRNIRVKS